MTDRILHKPTTCPRCKGKGTVYVIVPDSLRAIREAAGMKLRAFARRVKLSAPYISDVELGRRACTDTMRAAYEALIQNQKHNKKNYGKIH